MTLRIVKKPGEKENIGAYEDLIEMYSNPMFDVHYDPARGLVIKTKSVMIAIRNSYSPEWTFMDVMSGQIELLDLKVFENFANYQ